MVLRLLLIICAMLPAAYAFKFGKMLGPGVVGHGKAAMAFTSTALAKKRRDAPLDLARKKIYEGKTVWVQKEKVVEYMSNGEIESEKEIGYPNLMVEYRPPGPYSQEHFNVIFQENGGLCGCFSEDDGTVTWEYSGGETNGKLYFDESDETVTIEFETIAGDKDGLLVETTRRWELQQDAIKL